MGSILTQVLLLLLEGYPYFVGNASVLYEEYESYCKQRNGEAVHLDYNPNEEISEFDELGMFLNKWARNFLIDETLEVRAFYFWTALHFTMVRVLFTDIANDIIHAAL